MSQFRSFVSSLDLIFPKNKITGSINKILVEHPEVEGQILDAYSLGQVKSKLWLIDHLPNNLGTIFLCAGWFGTLANLMFERCPQKFKNIRSFDIDPQATEIAEILNKEYVIDGWRFKATTKDIMDMRYPTIYKTRKSDGTEIEIKEIPDTFINTSSEHIENFEEWYSNLPYGKTLVLQNNNYLEVTEHVNCVNSLEEFASQTPMSRIIYQGELDLGHYKRFMRIGVK